MSNRQTFGLAAVACVACCIGPILGVLGAIAALGLMSSLLIGVAGLVVAAAAALLFIAVRRRPATGCRVDTVPVTVELGARRR